MQRATVLASLTVSLACGALAFGALMRAGASTPDALPLTPSSGPSGTLVTVTPTFATQTNCQVTWASQVVASGPCGAQASPYPSFTVTADGKPGGEYEVQACQPDCQQPVAVEAAPFAVGEPGTNTGPPSQPASGPPSGPGHPAQFTPRKSVIRRSTPASASSTASGTPSLPRPDAPATAGPTVAARPVSNTTRVGATLVALVLALLLAALIIRQRGKRRSALRVRIQIRNGRRVVVCEDPSRYRHDDLDIAIRRTRLIATTSRDDEGAVP